MTTAPLVHSNSLRDRPVLVFADLDDTCFQTERKCVARTALLPAAWDRSGKAISFQSPAQTTLLSLLTANAPLIPVTGRNRDAVDRTMYREATYAITSFGAVIHTPDGPDAAWEARQQQVQPAVAHLVEISRVVEAYVAETSGALRCSLVHDAGQIRYLSVKANGPGPTDPLVRLVDTLRDRAVLDATWRLYRTDRSLAIAPPHIEKAAAVRHFLATHASTAPCTIGIGDGPADAGFLALCDFAVTPRGSALFQRLVSPLS